MTTAKRYTAKRANKYDGKCCDCGQTVPAGTGVLFRQFGNRGDWMVAHKPLRTVSPTGPWDKFESYTTGGCPSEKAAEEKAIVEQNGENA